MVLYSIILYSTGDDPSKERPIGTGSNELLVTNGTGTGSIVLYYNGHGIEYMK